VTHAGVIRAALAAGGVMPREQAAAESIAFGSVRLIGAPLGGTAGMRVCATS
jgi:hypothetical protein